MSPPALTLDPVLTRRFADELVAAAVRLRGEARGLVGGLPGVDVDDFVQDAVLVVWGKHLVGEQIASAGAYLRGVMRRHALSVARQARARAAREQPLLAEQIVSTLDRAADSAVLSAEQQHFLDLAADALTPAQLRVWVLRAVYELTDRQIGDALGMATGTVRAHLHEARRRMRTRLAEEADRERLA